MIKKIEIPENCLGISVHVGKNGMIDDTLDYQPSDLESYPDEPRTADGLTLRAFLLKVNGDISKIELFRGGKWYASANDNIQQIINDIVYGQINLSCYRINPEVVHYNEFPRVPFCESPNASSFTADIPKVTCPECREKLKYEWIQPGVICCTRIDSGIIESLPNESGGVLYHPFENLKRTDGINQKDLFPVKHYEPWTEENAPDYFEDSNGNEWNKCHSVDSWGYICFDKGTWHSFSCVLDELEQKDGTPCGTPVPDLDYYKQFEAQG